MVAALFSIQEVFVQSIKYIRVGDDIIIFSAAQGHDEVAKAFGGPDKVDSAGLLSVRPDPEEPGEVRATTYGESHTLKKRPDSKDNRRLKMMFSDY